MFQSLYSKQSSHMVSCGIAEIFDLFIYKSAIHAILKKSMAEKEKKQL